MCLALSEQEDESLTFHMLHFVLCKGYFGFLFFLTIVKAILVIYFAPHKKMSQRNGTEK